MKEEKRDYISIVTTRTMIAISVVRRKLIDYGSTHNFINHNSAKLLNYFIYPTPYFHVIIIDGDTINC